MIDRAASHQIPCQPVQSPLAPALRQTHLSELGVMACKLTTATLSLSFEAVTAQRMRGQEEMRPSDNLLENGISENQTYLKCLSRQNASPPASCRRAPGEVGQPAGHTCRRVAYPEGAITAYFRLQQKIKRISKRETVFVHYGGLQGIWPQAPWRHIVFSAPHSLFTPVGREPGDTQYEGRCS